jgi:hypothetical protein
LSRAADDSSADHRHPAACRRDDDASPVNVDRMMHRL